MNGRRAAILDWAEHGHLEADALPVALRSAGVTPDAQDWRQFFDRLGLWLGVIFLAAAVIFFFAYNWQAMGRFAKFGLLEALIVASAVASWRLDLAQASGKAALLLTALLLGALLALTGQTYQTGADTYELFAAWALAILPLVVVGRFGALWLVWIALINLALIFYYQVFSGLFGLLFSSKGLLWSLFAFNTLALCVWELGARQGIVWLRQRAAARVLVSVSGGLITLLAMLEITSASTSTSTSFYGDGNGSELAVYFLWMAAAYAVYRKHIPDLFVLAGGVLSAIIVISTFLSKHLLQHDSAAGLLLIGMIVIGLSAAGGFWLKSIAHAEGT
jgi:uncharacterized membrane protein